MKVPGPALVDHVVRDMATVEGHGHHSQLLDGVDIWGERDVLDLWEGVSEGGRLEVGVLEVK